MAFSKHFSHFPCFISLQFWFGVRLVFFLFLCYFLSLCSWFFVLFLAFGLLHLNIFEVHSCWLRNECCHNGCKVPHTNSILHNSTIYSMYWKCEIFTRHASVSLFCYCHYLFCFSWVFHFIMNDWCDQWICVCYKRHPENFSSSVIKICFSRIIRRMVKLLEVLFIFWCFSKFIAPIAIDV